MAHGPGTYFGSIFVLEHRCGVDSVMCYLWLLLCCKSRGESLQQTHRACRPEILVSRVVTEGICLLVPPCPRASMTLGGLVGQCANKRACGILVLFLIFRSFFLIPDGDIYILEKHHISILPCHFLACPLSLGAAGSVAQR